MHNFDSTPRPNREDGEVSASAERLLRSPSLIDQIRKDIAALGVAGESDLALTVYLIATSRLLDRPLSGIIQGSSSSGKSYVLDTVASFFPPESVICATDITPQALYYGAEEDLVHQAVFAGERLLSHHPDATRALREMISSGRLCKMVAGSEAGEMTTHCIERRGPIAYLESTTDEEIFEEDRNRFLCLASDETPEQTRRIMEAKALQAASGAADQAHLISLHHEIQRKLQKVKVRIPFANELVDAMPSHRIESRRVLDQVLSLISAVALLHQFQRSDAPRDGQMINATLADYNLARTLLRDPLERALGAGIPEPVRRLVELLTREWKDMTFTVKDITRHRSCAWARTSLDSHLRRLQDEGVAFRVRESSGPRAAEWRVVRPLEDAMEWLPSLGSGEPGPDDRGSGGSSGCEGTTRVLVENAGEKVGATNSDDSGQTRAMRVVEPPELTEPANGWLGDQALGAKASFGDVPRLSPPTPTRVSTELPESVWKKNLLGDGNLKTEKGAKLGFKTIVLNLAPHDRSGVMNVCQNATPGCIAACTNLCWPGCSPVVQRRRVERTAQFCEDRERFLAKLHLELGRWLIKAEKDELKLAVRLNDTSDLPWEVICPELFTKYERVTFYDYTKSGRRANRFFEGHLPSNYYLVLSRSETNDPEAQEYLHRGGNVSVPFCDKKPLPDTWCGFLVIDGDVHDLRPLDLQGGVVVGIRAKRRGMTDKTGFVVRDAGIVPGFEDQPYFDPEDGEMKILPAELLMREHLEWARREVDYLNALSEEELERFHEEAMSGV